MKKTLIITLLAVGAVLFFTGCSQTTKVGFDFSVMPYPKVSFSVETGQEVEFPTIGKKDEGTE